MRYELGLKEQQIDRLRKEKLTEIGTLEKQYTEKVVNLEKTVESQKSELEFRVSFTAKYLFQQFRYYKNVFYL